jgi:dihydrolipoamide dehydrogenase
MAAISRAAAGELGGTVEEAVITGVLQLDKRESNEMRNNKPKEYDVIVIGSGAGAAIVEGALQRGLSVALVDRGPLGGTCLNVGCIPTKILTFPADRVVEIEEARKLGIEAHIEHVDFPGIMERMRRLVAEDQEHIRHGIAHTTALDFYEVEASFVAKYTLQVGDTRIRGNKIFVVAGARPLIPPIAGIEQVPYLTNETVLDLTEPPASLAIVGGGYIAVEFAHFFAAMGTQVTILQRNLRLVPEEEPEIAALLQKKLAERMAVHTGVEVVEARMGNDGVTLVARNTRTGNQREFTAEQVLIAAGRRSNADLLQVAETGVKTDARGYIVANEYLETNVPNIWAFGDVIGKQMFRHSANREASFAWHNAEHSEHKAAMDYRAVPHAVFTYPPVASVGLTEEEALEKYDLLVGTARYWDVAKGQAMLEADGFAKTIVTRQDLQILGFHIIGPQAPTLIQEVINVMAQDGTIRDVAAGMHIHPALPELVVNTLFSLREPE